MSIWMNFGEFKNWKIELSSSFFYYSKKLLEMGFKNIEDLIFGLIPGHAFYWLTIFE